MSDLPKLVREPADYPLAHDSPIHWVQQGYEIVFSTPNMYEMIEDIARTAYQSHESSDHTPEGAKRFVAMLVKRRHWPALEFGRIIVRIRCDRGVSHEIVRHRIASYMQESTRWCNYSKAKFGGQVGIIFPTLWPVDEFPDAVDGFESAARRYLAATKRGVAPEIARDLLPTATATRLVADWNIPEWRHVFSLRATAPAHPRMREIMGPMLVDFSKRFPLLFDDLDAPGKCPACGQLRDYDPDTWGNFYKGAKSGTWYVCPDCVGKGGCRE